MHFPTFEVASTNIFPLSNSTKGGQLVTEYNLRAREMVATDPNVQYEIGPSYTHGMDDFSVSLLSSMEADEYNNKYTYSIGQYVTYNSTTYVCIEAVVKPEPFDKEKWLVVNSASSIIQVAPGRAVINGHYVQTLAPMTIDLALANAQLAKNYEEALTGELCVGIRAYYSTESTMSGAMLIENEDNTYTGIQLVVEKKENFKTPSDSPADRSAVTADLKLADFIYVNGIINPAAIVQNKNKVSYINSNRIDDISKVLDDNFISKKNLNAHKLYTFSGQGGKTDKSTWCDSTGSLMVWDLYPSTTTINPNTSIPQATFLASSDGYIHLAVPHQQIDKMTNTAGENLFYNLVDLKLPKANYVSGAPGTVDANYTSVIKNLVEKVGSLKQSPAGNMVLWLDRKDGDYVMPSIPASYNDGDYIFVREDYTADTSEDEGAAPSTMYKVLPGTVTAIEYSQDDSGQPKIPTGIRLGEVVVMWEGDITNPDDEEEVITAEALKHLADFYDSTKNYVEGDYAAYNEGLYICNEATTGEWDGNCWDLITRDNALTLFNYNSYRGSKDPTHTDYFEISFHNLGDTGTTSYYYKVAGTGARTWSDYILVTGGIPLATEEQIGGFYNTDASATDGGYVTLDESGRLKLIDYELLRTGALAYQLGSNYTVSANLTADAVQADLDEYVNSRVAFPFVPIFNNNPDTTSEETELSGVPSLIHLYVNLPKVEEDTPINIYNIDSRFGTAVYIHLLGNADAHTIVNIYDCEKIRIDSSISGTPIVNVVRCGIYYDANVFNYIRTCDITGYRTSGFTGMVDISLWYDRFTDTDPDLLVNGMEVSQPNTPTATDEITFWDENNPNDNHYSAALRSITFSGNGDVVGCSVYVANGSTATNVTTGRSIIGGPFVLPQGSDLMYPDKCIVKPLKVTGSFTTAYMVEGSQWVVIATNFTIQTGAYNKSTDLTSSGTIAFDATTDLLNSQYMTMGVTTIDGWESGSYHIFYGGSTIGGSTL